MVKIENMILAVKRIIVLITSLSSLLLYSQPSITPKNIRAEFTLAKLSQGLSPYDMEYGIPLPPGGVSGTVYLDEEWNKTTILLYEGEKLLEGYLTRLDIKNSQLEIESKSGIKVLDARKIKSFLWLRQNEKHPNYYINAKDIAGTGIPHEGFYEILSDGKLPLLKQTTIVIKKPDYNAAIAMGSTDHKILKKEDYYLLTSPNSILEVPKSKKKLLTLFGEKKEKLEKFISTNSLSHKNENDLKRIMDEFNR